MIPSLIRYQKDIIKLYKAIIVIKKENRHLKNMKEQIVNILNDWIHISSQIEWTEDEENKLKPIINNETISYLYVNYIY